MEINIICMVSIFLITIVGAAVQYVTGFGMGIIIMLVFPIFYSMVEASALSGMICLVSTIIVSLRLRKSVKWNKLWAPTIAFIVVNYIFVVIATMIDVNAIKAYFGIFLVLMALYFLFLSKKIKLKGNHITGAISGVASGIAGGLFGVGGPLIVPYYLAATEGDKLAYIATIQMGFVFQNVAGVVSRAINGAVTLSLVIAVIPGILGTLVGNLIGSKIVGKVNSVQMTRIIYCFLIVAGCIVFVTNI